MFKKFKSLLAVLSVSLLAIMAMGCGSDNNEFVGVATGNQGTSTGNLSFAFTTINPQIAGDVSAQTARLQFAIFSTPIADPTDPEQVAAATLVDIRLVNFAESIVLEDVPTNAVTVLVTAVDKDGYPLNLLQGSFTVTLGETTPVDLGNSIAINFSSLTVTPDPTNVAKGGESVQLTFTIGFDNGTQFQLFSFDAPEASFSQAQTVADISSTGLVSTTVGGQNTTATATYSFNGIELQDDFTINTYCLEIVEAATEIVIPNNITGRYIIGPAPTVYVLEFVGPDGIHVDVTENENTTYALASPAQGVTVDPQTGILTADETASVGNVVVIATYTDPVSGLVLTDSVTIALVERTPD